MTMAGLVKAQAKKMAEIEAMTEVKDLKIIRPKPVETG
jgi:hypothetical protein